MKAFRQLIFDIRKERARSRQDCIDAGIIKPKGGRIKTLINLVGGRFS